MGNREVNFRSPMFSVMFIRKYLELGRERVIPEHESNYAAGTIIVPFLKSEYIAVRSGVWY